MGQAKIQIQILPDEQMPKTTHMVLSQALAKRLALETNEVILQFGSLMVPTSLALLPSNSSLIRICSSHASRLLLTNHQTLNAHFDPLSRRLSLGPLLGIMINVYPQSDSTQPFGEITRFLEECVHAGHSYGIQTYVFAPENIHLEKKKISAWSKLEGRWQLKEQPFPNIIYNRITSRRVEQEAHLQSVLQQLKERFQISLFNEKFLDKWEVHQLLVQEPHIRHMLPETHYFHIRTLHKMLQRYPLLYLKPVNGSLGSGIIRLIRSSKKVICQAASTQGIVTLQSTSIKKMIHRVHRRIGRQPYLVQQGLWLAKHERRPIDFRILVQKNRFGRWSITSSVGRIACAKQFVSNLARGGTVLKATDVLHQFVHTPKPTIAQLHQIALTIAQVFEQQVNGHFAELGIDLALDRWGKVWLIEINAKPSKTDDSVINQGTGIRPSVGKLISYILYLSGIQSPTKKQRRRKCQ